jgi:hypothetical protein
LILIARDMDRSRWQGLDRLGLFLAWAALIVAWNLPWNGWSELLRATVLTLLTVALLAVLVLRETEAIERGVELARSLVAPLSARQRPS